MRKSAANEEPAKGAHRLQKSVEDFVANFRGEPLLDLTIDFLHGPRGATTISANTQPNAAEFGARLQQRPIFNQQRDRAAWFGFGFGVPAVCGMIGVLASRRSKRKMLVAHASALAVIETELTSANAKKGALAEALGAARTDLGSKEKNCMNRKRRTSRRSPKSAQL